MDDTFAGIPELFCLLDDSSIVSKGDGSDHNKLVEGGPQKTKALNLCKLEFSKKSCTCLDFEIESIAIRPKHWKIGAILNLSPSETLKQLRSLMGVINRLPVNFRASKKQLKR